MEAGEEFEDIGTGIGQSHRHKLRPAPRIQEYCSPGDKQVSPYHPDLEYNIRKVILGSTSSAEFSRKVPILMQNSNGPCPLLALEVIDTSSNKGSPPQWQKYGHTIRRCKEPIDGDTATGETSTKMDSFDMILGEG